MDRTTPQALFTGTQAVSPAHRFNEANLDAWMRDHVPDYHGPIAVTQFKGVLIPNEIWAKKIGIPVGN